MTMVVLDLGSNIDREESLVGALERLSDHFKLCRASSVYRTVPVGMASQPDFYNVALEVDTDKSIEEIREVAQQIEDDMGRDRTGPKFGPRNIDIDIVIYGDVVSEEKFVPHPQSTRELFVVTPVAELLPAETHPQIGQTWKELRGQLMGGRSGKDAGISRECSVSDLPLGPKAKAALLKN